MDILLNFLVDIFRGQKKRLENTRKTDNNISLSLHFTVTVVTCLKQTQCLPWIIKRWNNAFQFFVAQRWRRPIWKREKKKYTSLRDLAARETTFTVLELTIELLLLIMICALLNCRIFQSLTQKRWWTPKTTGRNNFFHKYKTPYSLDLKHSDFYPFQRIKFWFRDEIFYKQGGITHLRTCYANQGVKYVFKGFKTLKHHRKKYVDVKKIVSKYKIIFNRKKHQFMSNNVHFRTTLVYCVRFHLIKQIISSNETIAWWEFVFHGYRRPPTRLTRTEETNIPKTT